MPERYERVPVGWHCGKVKGHAGMKIDKIVKTFSYDFLKLHHSNPKGFGGNVQTFFKTVKVIQRSHDVPPGSKYEKSKGHPRSPSAPNMVQFRPLFPELRQFKEIGVHHIYLMAAILKVRVKKGRPTNFGPIQAFFIELSC